VISGDARGLSSISVVRHLGFKTKFFLPAGALEIRSASSRQILGIGHTVAEISHFWRFSSEM